METLAASTRARCTPRVASLRMSVGRRVWRALRHPSWLLWKPERGEPGHPHIHSYANCYTFIDGRRAPHETFCDAHYHRSDLYRFWMTSVAPRYRKTIKVLVSAQPILVLVATVIVVIEACRSGVLSP